MKVNKYFEDVISIIKNESLNEKFIATGLTCNIDIVFEVDEINIDSEYDNSLLLPKKIESLNDFAKTIIYHSINTCGAEYTYDVPEVFEWAKLNYTHQVKIGGTGAQAANALSSIGRKIIFHCPELDDKVVELLKEDNIYIATDILLKPSEAINNNLPNKHYIFEVNKNTKINFKYNSVYCRRENRIMIRPEETLFIDERYFDYIETHLDNISSILISGFNATNTLKELDNKLLLIKERVSKIKKIQPNVKIYVENGDSNISGFKERIFWGITAFADIIGMNENEFEYIAKLEGIEVNYTKADELIEGIKNIYNKMSNVSCFVVHTRDYTIGLTCKENIYKLRDSIIAGNLFATCRAATGEFSSFDELVRITANTEFSKTGCEALNNLINKNLIKQDLCGWLNNEIAMTLVPTKILELPVCTVGLGDSFVAGFLSIN